MSNVQGRTKLLANVRSATEIGFGVLTFLALVYVMVYRFAASSSTAVVLFWVNYAAGRALLCGLMVYSGIKSSGRDPHALFGLNMGIGLASLFISISNILEYTLAHGDWKDAATVVYLPVGLIVLYITWYLRREKRQEGSSPVEG